MNFVISHFCFCQFKFFLQNFGLFQISDILVTQYESEAKDKMSMLQLPIWLKHQQITDRGVENGMSVH